jgi:uncharacterized protein (DUF39 family)
LPRRPFPGNLSAKEAFYAERCQELDEINAKIAAGNGRRRDRGGSRRDVRRAAAEGAGRKVDVVTTGTFGAMCSSGMFVNFGHPEPPIRMERITLDGVPAYGGVAAVDAYIGATETSPDDPRFGGAHVIERLVAGEEVLLRASGKGTDCYPRKEIETLVRKDRVNEMILTNPRNAYQNYPAATNTTGRTLHTTWGPCFRVGSTSIIPPRAACPRCSTTPTSARSASARRSSWAGRSVR